MKQAELRIEEKREKYAKSQGRGMKTLNEIANETHKTHMILHTFQVNIHPESL